MSHPSRPAAKPIAALIEGALDPLVRKRGLARAQLLSFWPEIVGEAYARHTAPERIRWPRDGTVATLFVACDPALALQFAHEIDRVRERLNGYFGYPAVGAVRIVQRRIGPEEQAIEAPVPEAELPAPMEERLGGVEGPLQDALRVLGRRVLAGS
jgi:hypothetical protein